MKLPEFKDITKEVQGWSEDVSISVPATKPGKDPDWDKHTVHINVSPTGNCQSTTIANIKYFFEQHEMHMAKAIFKALVEEHVPTTCVLLDVLERDIENTKELLTGLDTHEIIFENKYTNTTNSPMCMILASVIEYDPEDEEGDYDEEEEDDYFDPEWEEE